MMKPVSICKKHNPTKVIEDQDIHYFYWPIEIGATYIKIWNKKIPIFPIKLSDYEPIKETKFKNKIGIITRFHYDIFVYFNNLHVDNLDRPIVDFSFGSHSPLVHTDIVNSAFGTIEKLNWKGSKSEAIDAFEILYMMYRRFIQGTITLENCDTKQYELLTENIPDDVKFDPSKTKALFWIGTLPSTVELKHVGFNPDFMK